jgi:putative phosphoesterase
MLVGIIADTHDCLPMIRRAVRALNREGVALILHAGDFVAPFALRAMDAFEADVIGVFGNNDGDRARLTKTAAETEKVDIRGEIAKFEAGGLAFGLLHGSNAGPHIDLLEGGTVDVLVTGHTHRPLIGRYGRTLAINPGEACGYLSGTATAALLDTERKEARLIRL